MFYLLFTGNQFTEKTQNQLNYLYKLHNEDNDQKYNKLVLLFIWTDETKLSCWKCCAFILKVDQKLFVCHITWFCDILWTWMLNDIFVWNERQNEDKDGCSRTLVVLSNWFRALACRVLIRAVCVCVWRANWIQSVCRWSSVRMFWELKDTMSSQLLTGFREVRFRERSVWSSAHKDYHTKMFPLFNECKCNEPPEDVLWSNI